MAKSYVVSTGESAKKILVDVRALEARLPDPVLLAQRLAAEDGRYPGAYGRTLRITFLRRPPTGMYWLLQQSLNLAKADFLEARDAMPWERTYLLRQQRLILAAWLDQNRNYDAVADYKARLRAESRNSLFYRDFQTPDGTVITAGQLQSWGFALCNAAFRCSPARMDVDNRTRLRGAQLQLAIGICQLQGKLNLKSLEELVPTILPEMPLDPFQGKPFHLETITVPGSGPRSGTWPVSLWDSTAKAGPERGRNYSFPVGDPSSKTVAFLPLREVEESWAVSS